MLAVPPARVGVAPDDAHRDAEKGGAVTTFNVLMIDPPWAKQKGGKRRVRPQQGRSLDYPTMSVLDIFALLDTHIFPQAADTHSVFLWNIDEFLHVGEEEMARRGYRRHARLIWDKGNGIAPAFSVRYAHEYLTWFYKPRFQPVDIGSRGKFTSVIRAPGREHSRKPDDAYRMIEAWYPHASRIDVFSRELRVGWEQFGNETNHWDLL